MHILEYGNVMMQYIWLAIIILSHCHCDNKNIDEHSLPSTPPKLASSPQAPPKAFEIGVTSFQHHCSHPALVRQVDLVSNGVELTTRHHSVAHLLVGGATRA